MLGIDGALWRPADGPGHVASSSDDRPRLHTVIQGESLSTIAHGYGIKDWHAVWIDAKNETLRKRRKNPNVLLPGDEVMVPAVAVHEITRPTDQTHRLIVDAHAEVELDLVLEGAPTEPLAGHSCVLRYDGPQGRVTLTDLKIDDQGRLRVTLPILVKVVELEVKEIGETIALHLGALDPAADADTGDPEISGVQQRLWALGYAGAPTGRADEATRAALASFQARELGREDPTGELDAATSAKLEEYYGV